MSIIKTIDTNWADGILTGFDTETTGVDIETARIVAAAHARHAEHFENYRRSDGIEPDFCACRDWPYRKPA